MNAGLMVHVAGGAIALASLGVVVALRKGGRAHRRAGWAFVAGMTLSVASGTWLAVARGSWFLVFVGLLTASGIVTGLRASRTRSRTVPSRDPRDLAAPLALLAGAVALLALDRSVLGVIFALLGAARAASDLAFWLRAPKSRLDWLVAHIGAMGTAAIGAVTAFVVVNVQRFAPAVPSLLAWTLPGLVGGIVLARASAMVRRKAPDHLAAQPR